MVCYKTVLQQQSQTSAKGMCFWKKKKSSLMNSVCSTALLQFVDRMSCVLKSFNVAQVIHKCVSSHCSRLFSCRCLCDYKPVYCLYFSTVCLFKQVYKHAACLILLLLSLHRYETSCTAEQIPSRLWPGGEEWSMLRWYPGVKGHMGQLLLCS